MSQEFERKLAVEMMASKLAKECATNAAVHCCLSYVRHGDISLADGLTKCIQMLCEQNALLAKENGLLRDSAPAAFVIPAHGGNEK